MAWHDSFEAMLAADLESSFVEGSEFADSVIYYAVEDSTGRPIACQASLGQARISDDANHTTTVSVLNVLCHRDEETGIATPQLGDSVRWREELWDYLQTKGEDGGSLTLQFTRHEIQQYGKKPSQL